jgi:hypothetical protein
MSRAIWILALASSALLAQQNTPHAGYVYPAGGRQGETVEVVVGGQFLDGVNKVFISGKGIEATVAEYIKPITQGQANTLRDQIKELTEKNNPADSDKIAQIRLKLAQFIKRPMTPALAETVHVQVKLDANAEPGARQLRLLTTGGLTNPIVFCVGTLPEIAKKAAKVTGEPKVAAATKGAKKKASAPVVNTPVITDVKLPAIINGQIAPGGVDHYRFAAAKGQHVVIAAAVRELIPYISDAVPGWFQATLALRDASGKEVDYGDHYGFHQDPVLYYEIPADGQYTLDIHDSIYRGREDFVYRIQAGELPYLTGIFPLGGKAGQRTKVELTGWNLPAKQVVEDEKGKAPGVQFIELGNRLPFAVDNLPEMTAKSTPSAQKVKLPVIVNGRIDHPGATNVFRIDGRPGDEIVAEVIARRLDSPLDSILRLTDAKGKEIASNDDFEDKGAPLITHQADSKIQVKLPGAGSYFLTIGDTQHKGGPEYAYRLRISKPQPDFQLRVTPASVNARTGTAIPITVYALRHDGFEGEISLKLKDVPNGFHLTGGWIPQGQNSVRLTLSMPANRVDHPVNLHLEGSARVEGKEVQRVAVPAEDMMQAFAYRHLVTEDAWMARVTGAGRVRTRLPQWKLASDKPVKIPAASKAPAVKVLLPLGRYPEDVEISLSDPPEGITIDHYGVVEGGLAIVLKADGVKAKPGLGGNVIAEAFMPAAPASSDGSKKARRRTPLGTLPAIPFEVVATTIASASR